ncbi:MAG: hypothetical protein OEW11_00020 [Nitrospirota bacterium]|nr:hypothetical protein [Nitrospirota bacterium]
MRARPPKKTTSPERRPQRYAVQPVGTGRSFRIIVTRLESGEVARGVPVSLNSGGMLAECDALFPANAEVTINAVAHENHGFFRFSTRAWVAYNTGNAMAFQFDGLSSEAKSTVRDIVRLFLPGRKTPFDPHL